MRERERVEDSEGYKGILRRYIEKKKKGKRGGERDPGLGIHLVLLLFSVFFSFVKEKKINKLVL